MPHFSIEYSSNLETKIALLQCAEVFLLPSLVEGLSLSLLEAMATGLPIITTRVDGIPEVVKGSGSTLVNSGDVEALRTAIEETLSRNNDETNNIINMGKNRASNLYKSRRLFY